MENKEIDIASLFKALNDQKKKLLLWGGIGLIAGLIIAFSIPREWTSTTKLVAESKQNNNIAAQMGGLASMMGVDPSGKDGLNVNSYPVIIESAPFLQEFVDVKIPFNGDSITLKEYLTKEQKLTWWRYVLSAPSALISLFSSEDSNGQKDIVPDPKNPKKDIRVFENVLKNRTGFELDKKTGLITISCKMQDPVIAAIVADSLFSKMQRYMANYFTSKARFDLENSKIMLEKAKQEFYQADTRYAEATDKNRNLTSQVAITKIYRLRDERNIAFSVYQQLATQVEMNKIKVQEDTPIATLIESSRVSILPSAPNRKLIIIGMAFFGIFAAAFYVVVKKILKDHSSQ